MTTTDLVPTLCFHQMTLEEFSMLTKRHILVVLFLLLPTVVQAESYLCIADMSVGFKFESQGVRWKNAQYNTDQKYIDSRSSNPSNSGKWIIKEIGHSVPSAFCDDEFTEIGSLRCSGLVEFRMNKKNLRFLVAYLFGYWTDSIPGDKSPLVEGENTPSVDIGKCSPL